MKALSLWQPWASFIAIGAKRYETRDWPPPKWLIGQRIAIHAAKKAVNADDRAWAREQGVEGDLPLGAIVCTAILVGAYQCGGLVNSCVPPAVRVVGEIRGSAPTDFVSVDILGDYSERRWAWRFTEIERFDPAIAARGAQGLWNWAP